MSNIFCTYFAVVCVQRFQSCNLHCYVFSHFFYCIVYNVCLNVNQNTDLTAHVCIRSYETVFFCNLCKTTDVHVLADGCDLMSQFFFYSSGLAECPLFFHKCIDICCFCVQSQFCNLCNISLELFILCNKVCLSIYFYCNSFFTVFGNFQHYDTFCCNSSCFFLSGCQSFFSQELNSLVHITVCSSQGFFTVHHTCSGHLS